MQPEIITMKNRKFQAVKESSDINIPHHSAIVKNYMGQAVDQFGISIYPNRTKYCKANKMDQ
jgi:hypothetical protein